MTTSSASHASAWRWLGTKPPARRQALTSPHSNPAHTSPIARYSQSLKAALQKTFGGHAQLEFYSYLRGLQTSGVKLAETYGALQESNASADRIFELLDGDPEVRESARAVALPRVGGAISFEDVTFGYEPGRPVLRGISLNIEAGEVVAIVGGTGAGKSTLAGLVPRLFDPTSGRVLIDGHHLRDVTLASLRSQVSLVLQESFLFPITVAANIAYGRPDATHEQIEDAARAANAHDFVSRLPQGYETVIGERGSTFSGGERQRLSIARALLRDAPILILDEPTRALDTATEADVMVALRRLMGGRTTLLIAHRLSTVRNADRIIVLEHGRVAEEGTHEQLLHRAGLYATLSNLQSSERSHDVAEVAR